ncbi:copper resistance CopC family protein [Phytohabitans kaempferiae]|uniref:Copper resistance protein CopC n=1 Tax=Phytohabitans kaempferiae TaxID=1620943 RepID=A0ABV6M570_9ACTN
MRPEPRLLPGRTARAVLTVGLAGLLVLAPGGAARADGGLVRASPPVGGVLDAPPAVVTLTFSDDVQPELSHIAVFDDSGAEVGDGGYDQPAPRLIRLPVDIGADGAYTVAYHVTFPDGTSVTDVYRFSVGTGRAPAPLDAAEREARTEAVSEHAHQIDTLSAVLLVIDGAVLLVAVALLWLRPRGRRRPMSLRSTEIS